MAYSAPSSEIIVKLRHHFTESWITGLPDVIQVLDSAARILASYVAEPTVVGRRRAVAEALQQFSGAWLAHMMSAISDAGVKGAFDTSVQTVRANLQSPRHSLIETEVVASRLALAIMEECSSEFTDLRTRVISLEQTEEIDSHDILRPNVISRVIVNAWVYAGFSMDHWSTLQPVLHQEFSNFAIDQYHEVNRYLLSQGVRPEIHLRPLIRHTLNQSGYQAAALAKTDLMSGEVASRLTTLEPILPISPPPFETDRKKNVESRHHLITQDGLQQQAQTIKNISGSETQRGTIEIVAWLFQSILAEERIPAIVRVWFARLQMPVLRVAVSEPDFFALADHPARRLINRMGGSVMGFETGNPPLGEALEKEIKRIVQVVEAYPDTGRRVFQTVLGEFERFLENFFKNDNEAARKGVSLAQQVEQREALAIQYTIEIRKMLNEVSMHAGVREFLFHVWADVLATSELKFGAESQETQLIKRTAKDLIWSCSTKVSKEERAEVIRRLPGLLENLRDGMREAGISEVKQDEYIQSINNSLAIAFTSKANAIHHNRLKNLISKLEALEEMLPDAADMDIDESMVLDLSADETSELELVTEGGGMPTAPILALARELELGSSLMLDYHDRRDLVKLVWKGSRRQLSLFVSPQGRAILFQRRRLAAFLQAGLLVPAQESSFDSSSKGFKVGD